MAVTSLLKPMVIIAAEQSTVAAVTPFEDATGMLSAANATLAELIIQLTYLNGNMPAGTNKTNITTALAALSA